MIKLKGTTEFLQDITIGFINWSITFIAVVGTLIGLIYNLNQYFDRTSNQMLTTNISISSYLQYTGGIYGVIGNLPHGVSMGIWSIFTTFYPYPNFDMNIFISIVSLLMCCIWGLFIIRFVFRYNYTRYTY